jgi:hypothetical protein
VGSPAALLLAFEVLHIPSAKTPNGTWKARLIGYQR